MVKKEVEFSVASTGPAAGFVCLLSHYPLARRHPQPPAVLLVPTRFLFLPAVESNQFAT